MVIFINVSESAACDSPRAHHSCYVDHMCAEEEEAGEEITAVCTIRYKDLDSSKLKPFWLGNA